MRYVIKFMEKLDEKRYLTLIVKKGIYPALPGNVTWLSNNLAGDYKRAAGMALHIGVGNFAGGEFPSVAKERVSL